MDGPHETVSAYELRLLALGERIATALERIDARLEQVANDDPLSRVERALERAPSVLGFDPFADRNEVFDHRFAGPIEERTR